MLWMLQVRSGLCWFRGWSHHLCDTCHAHSAAHFRQPRYWCSGSAAAAVLAPISRNLNPAIRQEAFRFNVSALLNLITCFNDGWLIYCVLLVLRIYCPRIMNWAVFNINIHVRMFAANQSKGEFAMLEHNDLKPGLFQLTLSYLLINALRVSFSSKEDFHCLLHRCKHRSLL